MAARHDYRLNALEARFDRFEALLLAHLEGQAPANQVTPAPKAPAKKAPKKAAKKAAPKTKAVRLTPAKGEVLPLTKARLSSFKAAARKDGYDFAGWSTKRVAAFCIKTGYAPKGFVIGEGYRSLLG